MKKLSIEQSHSQPFELVLMIRDANGNPTGTRTCITDSPYKLSQFFLRHKGKPKKKKKAETPKDKDKIVKQHESLQAYVDTPERVVDETEGSKLNDSK